MLYELLFPLRHDSAWLGFFNVLRYLPFRTIAATVTARLLPFVLAPWFTRELQRKQIGQVVRDDGPETHKIKSGTPTMGGALILVSVLIPTILWCDPRNVFVWATTAVTRTGGNSAHPSAFPSSHSPSTRWRCPSGSICRSSSSSSSSRPTPSTSPTASTASRSVPSSSTAPRTWSGLTSRGRLSASPTSP